MGTLIYGASERYEFDDRLLAHIKMAMIVKLRRRESFLMNWSLPQEHGSGRMSLWMSPFIQLQFRFSGGRAPVLNRAWVEALTMTAHRTGGMEIMAEADAAQFILQQARLATEA